MLLEMNLIEGPYVRDILNQPEALRRSVAGFDSAAALQEFARSIAQDRYRRIVLTGMGSSLFALYPLHLKLIGHKHPSLLIETAELVYYMDSVLDSQTLVIAVSQSGESAEMVKLTELVKGRAPLLAVTNTVGSRLAKSADALVTIQAGPEATVSCKTYVSSLLALEWIGTILTKGDAASVNHVLRTATSAVDTYLSNWREHVSNLTDTVAGVKQIFVTGRGCSLATAQTGGLILKESARFPAEGMSCAAFRHGPFEMLGPQVLVVVLAGEERSQAMNRRLATDVNRAGGRAVIVDFEEREAVFRLPRVPETIRPVVEILPIQMISLALSAQTGKEAGRFTLATKVTSID